MVKSTQNKQLQVMHEEQVRTESSGKRSDNFYRAIFENIKVPIIITDKDLKVITINTMFEIMSGYSLDELVGKNAWTLIASPESLQKTQENHWLRKLNPDLAPIYYEIESSDKEGNVKQLNLHASFIPDTEEIVVSLVDITGQRRAESMFKASENYYQTIFENTGAVTLLIEQDMTISMVNKECEKLLGYKKEELIGEKMEKIIHKDCMEKVRKYHQLRRIDTSKVPLKYEVQILDKQGDIRDGLLAVDIIPGTKTSVATFIDLTDYNRTVQEMEIYLKKMQRVLIQAANSLGKTLEKRDPYTAGHQRKVAELSTAIAKEMKLSSLQCEGISASARLHDIGKITIPTEILSRPGELSDLEMAIVKTHCQAGYEIIKEIEFPWPAAEIILQHHERINGSGYPNGLTGDEILLEARIIAVADVVEAMASHRPYRPTRGIDEALKEITNNKNILYDPDVVDACLKLFSEKNYVLE